MLSHLRPALVMLLGFSLLTGIAYPYAITGLAQVTALAPTGAEAEMRAKAALLSGPSRAAEWLPHGGLIVADDGRLEVLPAAAHFTHLGMAGGQGAHQAAPQPAGRPGHDIGGIGHFPGLVAPA